MPFVVVPGAMELVVKGINKSQNWVNVFHIATDEFATPTPADVAAKCGPAYWDSFAPLWNTSCAALSITVRDLSAEDGEQSVLVAPGGAKIGTKVGEGYAPQIAVLVQKRTTKVGRANRGRMYVPGLVEGDLLAADGQLVAASLTAWQNAANAWMTASNGTIDTANVNLCVVSRYKGVDLQGKPAPRPVGLKQIIDTVPVSGYIATQRERLKRF
jgi:hypothetical protein